MRGNFSGIAAPIITGLVVDWSGSFAGAFLVAAGFSAIGVLCWAQLHPTAVPEPLPLLG